jgi:hypothetical protein
MQNLRTITTNKNQSRRARHALSRLFVRKLETTSPLVEKTAPPFA